MDGSRVLKLIENAKARLAKLGFSPAQLDIIEAELELVYLVAYENGRIAMIFNESDESDAE